uniref:Uncharacterized protein n=1 Tax=Opuntia streptacantha TaxID=393608 RepID=A0A7C9EIK5_OPUST
MALCAPCSEIPIIYMYIFIVKGCESYSMFEVLDSVSLILCICDSSVIVELADFVSLFALCNRTLYQPPSSPFLFCPVNVHIEARRKCNNDCCLLLRIRGVVVEIEAFGSGLCLL